MTKTYVTVSCERCHGSGHIASPSLCSGYEACPDCDANGYQVQGAPLSEFVRDGVARYLFNKAMAGYAQWDDMSDPNKEDWRTKADAWIAADQKGYSTGGLTSDLMNATTVSCTGLDITIACNDHGTKDALMEVLVDARLDALAEVCL